MKNTNIGSRLMTAASFVDNGNVVCDVGCDHGKLACYLIQSGKAKYVVATDVNKKPLQKAIELFKNNNIEDKASFYLTDGLQNVQNTNNITDIVIAGLGGETMAQIIEDASFIKNNKPKLILIPAQNGHKIRRYLFENGFTIEKEQTVKDKKKYYACIVAKYTGVITTASIYNCYIGKSDSSDNNTGYVNLVLNQLEKIKNGQIITHGNCEEELEETIYKINSLLKK